MVFNRSHRLAALWFLGFMVLIFPSLERKVIGAPLEFNMAPRYQIGLNTIQTICADLDGDGLLDIAAVNGGQGNPHPKVTILYGKANGSFEDPVVLQSYLIGHTITAGDLDHDGLPELVVASWYQNGIAVFRNLGDRHFSDPIFSVPPDPPYPGGSPIGEFFDLAIADFDGDGNNDVVGLQDQINQRLRFFHPDQQGLLTVFATLDQIESPTSYERKIKIGDINGDDRPDIVFAGGGPFGVRNISFVFGQPVGGTLSMTWGFTVEDKIVGLSINDLDNDGDNDLAVAFYDSTTPSQNSLRFFRNDGSGVFTIAPRSSPDYLFPPDDLTIGDFNNDGIQDVAALISSNLVLLMTGNGDLTYRGENYYSVTGSSYIISADLNRDNKMDLVTASSFGLQTSYPDYEGVSNNAVSVLFNDPFRGFDAPPAAIWGGDVIDAGDFNNDRYKDLVSSWLTMYNSPSTISLLLNDTHRGLRPEVTYASSGGLSDMKVGDFNGDGISDIITAHAYDIRRLVIYFGNGRGTLHTPIIYPVAQPLNKFIVGDFNRDGKDDVFVVDGSSNGYSMLSVGNGTFVMGSPITVPDAYSAIQKGDFNGDHNLDLVITGANIIKLWIGDGAGQFVESGATIPPLLNVVPGDFNGDGKLDLAGMTGTDGDYIMGILGDGNGRFSGSFSHQIRNFDYNATQSIVSADFDLDGFDDIAMIMVDNVFGNLIVVPSGGSAGFWKPPVFFGLGTATRKLVATDFNGDGRVDLGYVGGTARGVIYNTSPRPSLSHFDYDGDGKTDISVYRPTVGNWYLQQSTLGLLGTNFGISTDKIAPTDYDGDGKTDVAVYRPETGMWYVVNSSNGTVSYFNFGLAEDLPTPADYDGDGRADFSVFRPSTATWYRQNSRDGSFYAIHFGTSEDKPTIGDFDGDGKADIAIFRPSDGAWYQLYSSDGSLYGRAFGFGSDVITPADYDGDGKTDIAVFRPSDGLWYIANSSDGSISYAVFGLADDIPAPGDFDGDGKADVSVFRPSDGTWYRTNSSDGSFFAYQFGVNGDIPTQTAFRY